MARKNIYTGFSLGLYRPHRFLIFMNQGDSGSQRRPVELLDFKYGTSLVRSEMDLSSQIWHIHHYGVTVDYKLEGNRATVTLYGENVPLKERGILGRPPISEIERIIVEEAKNPRYTQLEEDAGRVAQKIRS